MILESRTGDNRVTESRTDFGSSTPPTWAMISGTISPSGRMVTPNQATTIPTVIGALQLIAGAAATLPLIVYRGSGEEKKPLYDVWQYKILESYPSPNSDPFQFKYDVFWHLENYGNAFVLKVKDKKGLVTELITLDPETVAIRNEKGQKKFDIHVGLDKRFVGATVNEILHLKLLPKAGSMFTGTCGLKLMTARLGAEISATEWEGRFFQNDATPPLVIILGEDAGVDEMKEAYDSWQSTHGGVYNAGKPAIIGGGAKIEKIGFNLADAQLITAHEFNVMEFARGMNMPLSLFIPPHTKPANAEEEALLFQMFYLSPRLRRFESAFASDPDFFAFNDMWLRFDEKSEIRAGTQQAALARHAYVQDGVLLPDEVRAELGYGPLPPLLSEEEAKQTPGKIAQITPVGGAPNDLITDGQLTGDTKSTGNSG